MQGLDPRVIAAWRLKAKRQLRQRMRGLRAALPKSAHAARSQAICERVASLAEFQRAERVALFWPMVNKHETDLRPLDAVARQANKAIAYPYLERDGTLIHTGFRWVPDLGGLCERGAGFHEPDLDLPRASPGEIDLIVLPALAASEQGYRLGYGLGFYDVTLPEFRPPAVAVTVCFDFQLVAELPHEEHDIACDLIVTDRRQIAVQK